MPKLFKSKSNSNSNAKTNSTGQMLLKVGKQKINVSEVANNALGASFFTTLTNQLEGLPKDASKNIIKAVMTSRDDLITAACKLDEITEDAIKELPEFKAIQDHLARIEKISACFEPMFFPLMKKLAEKKEDGKNLNPEKIERVENAFNKVSEAKGKLYVELINTEVDNINPKEIQKHSHFVTANQACQEAHASISKLAKCKNIGRKFMHKQHADKLVDYSQQQLDTFLLKHGDTVKAAVEEYSGKAKQAAKQIICPAVCGAGAIAIPVAASGAVATVASGGVLLKPSLAATALAVGFGAAVGAAAGAKRIVKNGGLLDDEQYKQAKKQDISRVKGVAKKAFNGLFSQANDTVEGKLKDVANDVNGKLEETVGEDAVNVANNILSFK